MRKKYIVVAFGLFLIMVIEILIYKKHKASNKTRLVRCYPSAVMYPHKDANKKINTESFYHTISHLGSSNPALPFIALHFKRSRFHAELRKKGAAPFASLFA
jgi:hypothetical protein